MGFRAGLKNAGKWFRVNDLVRRNAALKNAINTDAEVQAALDTMDGVLAAEMAAAGIPNTEFAESIAAQGFPIPLRIWQGRLVYSAREPGLTGQTQNQRVFLNNAQLLRERVDQIIRAFSMLSDAYEKPGDTHNNPGGVVSETPGT